MVITSTILGGLLGALAFAVSIVFFGVGFPAAFGFYIGTAVTVVGLVSCKISVRIARPVGFQLH